MSLADTIESCAAGARTLTAHADALHASAEHARDDEKRRLIALRAAIVYDQAAAIDKLVCELLQGMW